MMATACMDAPVQRSSPQSQELTGQSLNVEAQCDQPSGNGPLATQWMSEALIARTQDVWGRYLEREVDRDEAVEILLNVKRIAMVFHDARQEGACE